MADASDRILATSVPRSACQPGLLLAHLAVCASSPWCCHTELLGIIPLHGDVTSKSPGPCRKPFRCTARKNTGLPLAIICSPLRHLGPNLPLFTLLSALCYMHRTALEIGRGKSKTWRTNSSTGSARPAVRPWVVPPRGWLAELPTLHVPKLPAARAPAAVPVGGA